MRIVDRKTFLAMPVGTVFAKYDPSIIREPMVKCDSVAVRGELVDFRYVSLTDEVDCSGSFERDGIMDLAEIEGTPFALHFNTESRDALFDADQLFAVWGRDDVRGLVARLQAALADGYAPEGESSPRQEKMQQLALTNPIVRDCLDFQREPGVLYEDALEMMVIALAEQNAAALAELAAIRMRGLPPTVIVTSQEQADQIRARYVQGEESGSQS